MKHKELLKDTFRMFKVPVEYGPTGTDIEFIVVKASSLEEASDKARNISTKPNSYVTTSNISVVEEGGGVMRGEDVIRVNRLDIPTTIQCVSVISSVPINDLHPLGSTGKNPTSGDIDLGIDITKYDPEEIHRVMVTKLGAHRATYNKGTKVGSYAIPIAGDERNGLVQVDFMYVPNIEWAKFSYYSAGEASNYKGVIRTLLLRSVASSLEDNETDMFAYDPKTNDLMIRIGRTMDMNTGIRRIIQFRPKKKSGVGYLSTMKSVSMDELESTFPGLNFDKYKDYITIDDPTEALKVMFGFLVEPFQVETAEQVMSLIKTLPEKTANRILIKARENILSNKALTDEEVDQLFKVT
jgi:hypothetical protein